MPADGARRWPAEEIWLPGKQFDQAQTNRAYWDRTSDDYQQRHREFIGRPEPRWGVWQIRESSWTLGEVDGKDVLELGHGAAQWSILLAKWRARGPSASTT